MYKPELYDIVTPTSFRGDAEWYRGKARECGGPVLELGAGTGRITLGIAQASVSVHALDADPAMLDALRQKLANQPSEVQERVVVMVALTACATIYVQAAASPSTCSLRRRLLKQAGFQSVQIAGGFDGRPSKKTPTNW
jgi:SAM-dependent methyltransferase